MAQRRLPTDIPGRDPRGRAGEIREALGGGLYTIDFGEVFGAPQWGYFAEGLGTLAVGQHVRAFRSSELKAWEIAADSAGGAVTGGGGGIGAGYELVYQNRMGGVMLSANVVSLSGAGPAYTGVAINEYGGNIRWGAFNPAGTVFAYSLAGDAGITTDNQLMAYPWAPGIGFGAEYPFATLAGPVSTNFPDKGMAWSPDGAYVAVGLQSSPYIEVRPFDPVSGFGAKISNPASLPAGPVNSIQWSPDGSHIAVTTSTASPYVNAWAWTGSAFGSKVANPATLPAGTGLTVEWSPDSSQLAVGHATTPFVSVYPFTTAFGTKHANPGDLPAGDFINGLAFSADGSRLLVAASDTDYLDVYEFSSGGWGSRVQQLEIYDPAGTSTYGQPILFSPDYTMISIPTLNAATPFKVHAWDGDQIGAEVASLGLISNGALPFMSAWAPALGTVVGVGTPFTFDFHVHGTVSTGVVAYRLHAPAAMTIQNVTASVGTAPTGDDLIVDVNRNGSSIFTTQANRPTVAAGEQDELSAVPDVVTLLADDLLEIEVDQVGSSVAGADLVVTVRCLAQVQ